MAAAGVRQIRIRFSSLKNVAFIVIMTAMIIHLMQLPTNNNDNVNVEKKSQTKTSSSSSSSSFFRSEYHYQTPSSTSATTSTSTSTSKSTTDETKDEGKKATCAKNEHPNYDTFFNLNFEHRSRCNEDKWIYEAFFKRHVDDDLQLSPKTYVELGAFNGQRESNTNFFDQCLGWKGLLIEGNPRKYDELVTNRPNAHRMNFAPSCPEAGSHVTFMTTAFTNAGLVDKALTNNVAIAPKMDVPCGPLGPVLEHVFKEDNMHVNFFSLDVEGAEDLVLDTIDFDKVQIDIIMIEVVNGSCPKGIDCEVRNNVRSKMEKLGYTKYEEGGNNIKYSDVYVHPKSLYQLDREQSALTKTGSFCIDH